MSQAQVVNVSTCGYGQIAAGEIDQFPWGGMGYVSGCFQHSRTRCARSRCRGGSRGSPPCRVSLSVTRRAVPKKWVIATTPLAFRTWSAWETVGISLRPSEPYGETANFAWQRGSTPAAAVVTPWGTALRKAASVSEPQLPLYGCTCSRSTYVQRVGSKRTTGTAALWPLAATPPKVTAWQPAGGKREEVVMKSSSTPIGDVVDALADHIAQRGSIKLGELADFLQTRGITTAGGEELTSDHVNQPHVTPGTALLAEVSADYVAVVEMLFNTRPVMLAIGDREVAESHRKPWFVAWTGIPLCEGTKQDKASPCALAGAVDAAARFVELQGAVTFGVLASFLAAIGIETKGDEVLPVGDHPVDYGNDYRWYNTGPEITLCAGSTEFVAAAEALLNTKPVALKSATVGPTPVAHFRSK
jgi:hypothetical protein